MEAWGVLLRNVSGLSWFGLEGKRGGFGVRLRELGSTGFGLI